MISSAVVAACGSSSHTGSGARDSGTSVVDAFNSGNVPFSEIGAGASALSEGGSDPEAGTGDASDTTVPDASGPDNDPDTGGPDTGGSGSSGSCASGTKRCSGNQPQNCSADGAWQDNGAVCTTCSNGECTAPFAPECKLSDGGRIDCAQGDSCCGQPVSPYASSCATSCPGGTYPVNCMGSTGPNQCSGGTPVCCGHLTLTGLGSLPNCVPASLTSSCQASCSDSPPMSCSDNGGTPYTLRLCTAAADCSSDSANPNCCNFGTPPAPVNFCVSGLIKTFGQPNQCL